MRIAIDSHADDSYQSSREKVPTIPVSANPDSFPVKGSLAYNTDTDSIWYGNGSSWAPVGGGGGGVTQITVIESTGMPPGTFGIIATPNPITSNGTIALADTGVVPGFYINANIRVDQQGRLTFVESGAAPPISVGRAVDSNTHVVAYNSEFTFSRGSRGTGIISGPSVGNPGGTAFVIQIAGIYEFDFDIVAFDLTPVTDPGGRLIVQVYVNNAPTANPADYTYMNQSPTPSIYTPENSWLGCHGHGLIQLAANDSITLRNLSESQNPLLEFTASLSSQSLFGTPVATCSWSIKRIS